MQKKDKVKILNTQLKEILRETIFESINEIVNKKLDASTQDIIDSIQSKSLKQYFTFEEAAHYAGLSKRKIAKLKKNKQIPYLQIGGSVRFNKVQIDRWMLNNGHHIITSSENRKEI